MHMSAQSPTGSDNERLVELFAEVRNGNTAAFDELYDIVRRPLMAFCLAITATTEDAKDLFSTTMLKMYEAQNRFAGGNFEAWLFTIARNSARTEFRNRKRRPTVDTVDELPADDYQVLEKDEMELIRATVAKLPEEFRTVIMLKYFADMSVLDIAEAEEISPELVKTRLFRARQRLAESLRHLVEE